MVRGAASEGDISPKYFKISVDASGTGDMLVLVEVVQLQRLRYAD